MSKDISLPEPSKDETNPIAIPAFAFKRRRWRKTYWIIALLLIIVAVFAYLARARKNLVDDRLSAQLQINEILALEAEVRQERQNLLELFPLLQTEVGIDTSDWQALQLKVEQLQIIGQKAESDNSAAKYLAALKKIEKLRSMIAKKESRLGKPALVKVGDSHFQLAYEHLVESRLLSPEKARRILQETRLQEVLLPGFKVWNFYFPDGFCTFVTQGDAPLTPEEAVRQERERQRQEKELALARLNSMHCLVGTVKELQAREILTKGFLKSIQLGEVNAGDFSLAIDLRYQRNLRISATALGLKSIARLAIFPRDFREGRDYKVRFAAQGRYVQLLILRPDFFRDRRLVIAVE